MDAPHAAERVGQRAQVFRRHPAAVVPGAVRVAEVKEREIRLLAHDVVDRRVGQRVLALEAGLKRQRLRLEAAEIERAGAVQVAQLLPVVEHRRFTAEFLDHIRDTLDRAHHRVPRVVRDAVPLRLHREKERGVARQRHRGHDCPRVKARRARPHQRLKRVVSARRRPVRAHAVDQNQNHLVFHPAIPPAPRTGFSFRCAF